MSTSSRSLLVSLLVLQFAAAPPVKATDCLPGLFLPNKDPALEQPMTFTSHYGVNAKGEITAGTSARFRTFLASNHFPEGTWIYLDSPGGDLDEGLALGRIIREQKFNTSVNWECFSSCTFAFLGGVKRQMLNMSMFGVHRFRFASEQDAHTAADEAQKKSAILYSYVRRMGVDARFMDEMVKSGTNSVNSLSVDELKALKVINSTPDIAQLNLGGAICW